MTPTEHEALIDRHERLMIEANDRTERQIHAAAFLAAIERRNAERTPEEVEHLEHERGLRA
jgi:hypothetical protein